MITLVTVAALMGEISPAGAVNEIDVDIPGAGGRTISAVMYVPENGAQAPGVLVLHTYYGMFHGRAESFDHDFGERLAGAGYVALVPDYAKFGRQGYVAGITEDLRAVASWFRARPETRSDRLSAVGFSAGAFHAARLAAHDETFKAVVGYYGPYDLSAVPFKEYVRMWAYLSPINDVENINVAFLILHGDKDSETPIAQARSFEKALKSAGKTTELVTYRGSYHRFDRGKNDKMRGERTESGATYRLNEDARDDAWKRTIEWLNRYLPK